MSHFFGEDGMLGGLPIRNGRNPGKWRPARRSIELQLAQRRAAQKNAGVTGKAAGSGNKTNAAAGGSLSPTAVVGAKAISSAPSSSSSAPAPTTPPSSSAPITPSSSSAPTPAAPPTATKPITPSSSSGSGLIVRRPASAPVPPPPPPPKKGAPLTAAGKKSLFGGLASMLAGAFLDGLGDAPAAPAPPTVDNNPQTADQTYQPNAFAWVSTEAVQLYWHYYEDYRAGLPAAIGTDGNGWAVPLKDPITWPDGTPMVSRIWLPMVDMRQGGMTNFVAHFRIGNPYGSQRDSLTDKWWDAPSGDVWLARFPDVRYYGGNTTGDKGEQGAFPSTGGPIVVFSNHEKYNASTISYNRWKQWDMACSFDWSTNNPTVQAYPWLADFITADPIGWVAQPADLWRSDGRDLSDASSVGLPGQPPPFLALDFLDALSTGAHGMPVCVKDDGTLDQQALIAWAQTAGAGWARMVDVWRAGIFLLATVYDNKPVTVRPVVNPVQPPPVQSDPTTSSPIDPTTGLPYPIDPTTGLPYDPSTGLPIDPYQLPPSSYQAPPPSFVDPSSGYQDPSSSFYPTTSPAPSFPSSSYYPSSSYDPSTGYPASLTPQNSFEDVAGGYGYSVSPPRRSPLQDLYQQQYGQNLQDEMAPQTVDLNVPATLDIDDGQGGTITITAYADENGQPYYVDESTGQEYDVVLDDSEEAAA